MSDMLPAAKCVSWCKQGDGHTDVSHPAEQHCESASRTVPLSRQPTPVVGAQPQVPDHLVGLLHQEADASVPHILVTHNEAIMVELSIEDARRLAAELLKLAGAATT